MRSSLPEARLEATLDTAKCSSSAACTTRAVVLGDTSGEPRRARETVEIDTPARCATSAMLEGGGSAITVLSTCVREAPVPRLVQALSFLASSAFPHTLHPFHEGLFAAMTDQVLLAPDPKLDADWWRQACVYQIYPAQLR